MTKRTFKRLKTSKKRKPPKKKRYHSSIGEIAVARILTELRVKFIREYKFKWLRGIKGGQMSLDFYLPGYNTAIEYDGIYHSKPIQKLNDAKKDLLLAQKKITLLRISYKVYNNLEIILKNYFAV